MILLIYDTYLRGEGGRGRSPRCPPIEQVGGRAVHRRAGPPVARLAAVRGLAAIQLEWEEEYNDRLKVFLFC